MSGRGIKYEVTGLKELAKRANRLDSALRKKVYNAAMKAAAKPIKARAAALVPVKTGAYKRALVVRSTSKPSLGYYGVKITVLAKLASNRVAHRGRGRRGKGGQEYHPDSVERYYRFQELGTKYHKAQPALKPALEDEAQNVIGIVKKEIYEGIEKALK